ncbi:MAG: hypothetical protein PHR25_04310 [Clostridia bacterium]|nr:hypothetical protein [Clostridia bacterium]MDD4375986.1 hypothetical protein [Clostridia bacterium]
MLGDEIEIILQHFSCNYFYIFIKLPPLYRYSILWYIILIKKGQSIEKRIDYQSTGSIILRGILNKKSDNKKIVILCHGFNSEKNRSVGMVAKKISEEGTNTFRFDFRSHGESDKPKNGMTITGEVEDLKAT